jgi:hypothetical protein
MSINVKKGTDMATSAPTSGQPNAPKDDFITKHGKRIVVIIFSILIGDALPTIIQNGLDPDKLFYTIVLMSLPYTGSLVLIFLLWIKHDGDGSSSHTTARMNLWGTALILSAGFALGYYTHWWGFSNADLNQIDPWFKLPDSCNHPLPHKYCGGNPRSAEFMLLFYLIMIFIQFYVTTYGLPMFIAATLASLVITRSILKGMEK